ncbi:MAG TPA: hypothetical protein VFL93_07130 [Longimicrobiaceae bacterium]|nr:hypothetical protein [Longimicrobiaceae bacterium]
MAIPWGDPWKLAQQARGGGGCKISGDDSYWVNAFNLVMARYPMPANSAAAAVPPVVAGALPAASSSTAAPVYVASSGGGGGLGLPLVLVAVVVIAAVGFYLVRRK